MANHRASGFLFRQLFDSTSSSYTYLLADTQSGEAAIIDSVVDKVERDLGILKELNLKLKYCISTHVHADHITGNFKIKDILNNQQDPPQNVKSVISSESKAKADILLANEDTTLEVGKAIKLNFLFTPGHTNGCMAIVDHKNGLVFTGDTLLIRGCGRTDFQEGSADKLYESVNRKLFTLPEDYFVYPAHDYNGRTVSTIGEEKKHNPRLTKTLHQFVNIMANLNLPPPKMIDKAVPRNLVCGL